jgi:pilus assembly protein CpaF
MWQIRKTRNEDSNPAADLEAARLMAVGDASAFETLDRNTEMKVELHQRLLDLINLSALETMSRRQSEEENGDI